MQLTASSQQHCWGCAKVQDTLGCKRINMCVFRGGGGWNGMISATDELTQTALAEEGGGGCWRVQDLVGTRSRQKIAGGD